MRTQPCFGCGSLKSCVFYRVQQRHVAMWRAFFQRGSFGKRTLSLQDAAVAAALGLASGYYIMLPMIQQSGQRALEAGEQNPNAGTATSAESTAPALGAETSTRDSRQ